jgi:hypothetical protein
VDPVPDPLLLRKSGSSGNRTWNSGSVARNSDQNTTEAVSIKYKALKLMIGFKHEKFDVLICR